MEGMVPAAWFVARLPDCITKEPRELQSFFSQLTPSLEYVLSKREQCGQELAAVLQAAPEAVRKSLSGKANKLQRAFLKQLEEL